MFSSKCSSIDHWLTEPWENIKERFFWALIHHREAIKLSLELFGTAQQCYFEIIYWKQALMPLFFNLGRYFNHIFEFTSEERTFTPSCSYFLSPTCSLLPPSLVVSYCFLVLLFPFLWCLWHLTSCWVFLGPLAVVSEYSPSLPFSYFCFSPLFLTSFIFLSKIYVSLSLSLHPYFDLENNMGFHWENKPGPNIFQKYLEVPHRCLFIPGLPFSVGTSGIFCDEHLLSC